MSRTVSIEQFDGLVAYLIRHREGIERKIVGLNEVKALLFGTDSTEGWVPPQPPSETRQRAMNRCAACPHEWPRSAGPQVRACPGCGSDAWRGQP